MATHTEVDAGLTAVAELIGGAMSGSNSIKVKVLAYRNQLANLATKYADIISTVNDYVPTGEFEAYQKDRMAKEIADKAVIQTMLEGWLDAMGVEYS
jgi:hypothetical protein